MTKVKIEQIERELRKLVTNKKSLNRQIESGRALVVDKARAIEECMQRLRGKVSLDHFMGSGQTGGKFPPDAEHVMGELRQLRTEFEVIPGVISRYEEEMQGVLTEIKSKDLELLQACRVAVLEEESTTRLKVEEHVRELCGDNAAARREIVEFNMARSRVRFWKESFRSNSGGGDAVAKAENTLSLADRFLNDAVVYPIGSVVGAVAKAV